MKNKILYGSIVMSVVAITLLNIAFMENDNQTNVSLVNVEAWADNETNDWEQWWSQGLTKDEREYERPCPSQESSSGSGNVSHGGTSVGGSGSHSQTNPSGRNEITCPYGSTNCTPIDCD